MTDNYRVLLLSDLHAQEESGKNQDETHYVVSESHDDPLQQLADYLEGSGVMCNAIICPGDMCNKADEEGLLRVWEKINDLKAALGASSVYATPGNHDMDSRQSKKRCPRSALQNLSPGFPVPESDPNFHKFWSVHYSVFHPIEHVRVLLVNSSAYHGYGRFVGVGKGPENYEPEYEYGRVLSETIERIRVELEEDGDYLLNILVCHHHLTPRVSGGQ